MNRQPQGNSQQAIQRKKSAEKISKKFEKPLDKPPQVCYNKGTRSRGKANSEAKDWQGTSLKTEKKIKKNEKKS